MTTNAGESFLSEDDAYSAEWDAILTYLGEVIGGSQNATQSTVAAPHLQGNSRSAGTFGYGQGLFAPCRESFSSDATNTAPIKPLPYPVAGVATSEFHTACGRI
ncbi:hypothetical protein [Sodalis glossinidius]|uniref:hypothetical protein n=1 Tax=Sodalis glossinidius TaxID=63612 RepID=UPI0005A47E56|nr:hypothetical protein [Sodalis glossinidius]